MNKSALVTLIIIIVAVVGGGWYFQHQQAKQQEQSKMAQEQAAMKAKDNAAMKEKDAMAKDKGMMEDSGPLMMAKNAKQGSYVTAANDMALYTYDKDSQDVSTCTGDCAKLWPPYLATGDVPSPLPEHLGTMKRDDGSTQYTWNGKPLYYYSKDKDKADVYGDGVDGLWHIAK
ncbi:MAG: COG4315 family predicted lipoprotein [Candidatus Levyibacteriota bacterium]